jgi:hypothetical protein
MASETKISRTGARAMLDALVDGLDALTTSEIHIFVGTTNAVAQTTPAGALLAKLVTTTPCFGDASDASPTIATAASITSDTSAAATGEAGCFWAGAVTTPGTIATGLIQGSAGISGDNPDLIFDDDMIVIGGTAAITGWTISLPVE